MSPRTKQKRTATEIPARSRRRLAPAVRRDSLLAALRKVAEENGYAQTTVAAVVRAARASHGTFYRYFPDLDTAFATLIQECLRPLADALSELDYGAFRSVAQVERELLSFYRAMGRQLARDGELLREALLMAGSAHGPVRAEVRVTLSRIRSFVHGSLSTCSERFPFRKLDPVVTGDALLGMALGAIFARETLRSPAGVERWAREMTALEVGALTRRATRRTAGKR